MNLISVVVPVYNTEKYVPKCIESILNQTYKNFQLILVNDGSTDQSNKICKSYSINDSRIILIEKENEGVSRARNIGIENATGDYITFIDSDDYVSSNYLETLITLIKKNNSDLAVCNYDRFYDTGTVISSGFSFEDGSYDIKNIKKMFVYNKSKFVLTAVVRLYDLRIIKDENIRFYEDMAYGEDYIFQLEYVLKCRQVSIASSRVMYHRAEDNPFSLSKNKNELSWKTQEKINEKLYIIVNENKDLKQEMLLNCLERLTQVYLRLIIESNRFKKFTNQLYLFFLEPKAIQLTKDIVLHVSNDSRIKYMKSITASRLALFSLYLKVKTYYSLRFFLKKIFIKSAFMYKNFIPN